MPVVPAGAGKEHGPACLGCVTGDKGNTQQQAEELPGGHRGTARSESGQLSHQYVLALQFLLEVQVAT